MATYLKPIVLEDVFNIINFQQIQNSTTSFLGYAQLSLSNTFKNIKPACNKNKNRLNIF